MNEFWEFLANFDYTLGALIAGLTAYAGWLWKRQLKNEGPSWHERRERAKQIRELQQQLPDLVEQVRDAMKGLRESIEQLSESMKKNDRKTARALAFAAVQFEDSEVAQVILDDKAEVVSVNNSLLELIKTDRTEIMGARWRQFLNPGHMNLFADEFHSMVANAIGRRGACKVRLGDGTWARVRFTITPRFEKGDPYPLFHVFLYPEVGNSKE